MEAGGSISGDVHSAAMSAVVIAHQISTQGNTSTKRIILLFRASNLVRGGSGITPPKARWTVLDSRRHIVIRRDRASQVLRARFHRIGWNFSAIDGQMGS